MSPSFGCQCNPRDKSNWRVLQRRCNHSAFNGYQWTPSDYSTVICLACSACGRTKAGYVAELADYKEGDVI